ncbi:MAG: phosphomannomutase/phosphoglucomutase [Planctomycetes bacterium]|nr:phosphomannomutase/phosphoglucomutase [Planctomycetota bacterium]MBI3844377.1 phosphomannomutase/phosphoglucomutase [Planctomycetota bacterium]
MDVHPGIFREYDIRGVADRELTADAAEAIGRAFGSMLRESGAETAAVGRDVRLSSDHLEARFAIGLARAGVAVTDVGMVTTPMLYYAGITLRTGGAAMITGSHNPVDWNGIKLVMANRPLTADEIQALRRRIEEGRFTEGQGRIETDTIGGRFLSDLVARFRLRHGMRVVVDAGNGAAGPYIVQLLRRLGVEVNALYCEPDGRFPNHLPDPEVPENVKVLAETVVAEHAEVGLAFDGDADRVGVVDDTGRKISADWLLALFAREMLKRFPGGKILYDVKCTDFIERDVRAHGGVPLLGKTGHSLLKKKMADENAVLGGELSGHIVFGRDYYPIDDSFYCALFLLQMLTDDARPLSQRFADFPRTVSTPEIKVPCSDDRKFGVVAEVAAELRRDHPVVEVDGARVSFADGWGLVRASNTLPVLTLRFEASTADALEKNRASVMSILRRHGVE